MTQPPPPSRRRRKRRKQSDASDIEDEDYEIEDDEERLAMLEARRAKHRAGQEERMRQYDVPAMFATIRQQFMERFEAEGCTWHMLPKRHADAHSSHVSSSCCVSSSAHKCPAFCVPAADTEEDFVLIDELGCPNGYFDLLASTLGKYNIIFYHR